MVALNPPSRPVMRPTLVPVERKKSQWGWWVLLAGIIIAVLVAAIVVIAKVVGGPPLQPRGNGPQETTQPAAARAAQDKAPLPAYPAATTGSTESDGQQGIMTPPWTEWNGTQR